VVIKFEDPAAAAVENRVVLRRELKLFYANLVGALLVGRKIDKMRIT